MTHKFIPEVLPDFAESGDYPAGVDDWSATPIKVEPDGTVRAAGVTPNDQMAAQHYNWLNHRYGRGVSAFVHGAMQSWRSSLIGVFVTETVDATSYSLFHTASAGSVVASCIVNTDQKAAPALRMLAVGGPSSDQVLLGADGHHWENSENQIGTELNDMVGELPGYIFAVAVGSRNIAHSVDFGEHWVSSANVSPASGSFKTLLVSGSRILAAITGTSDATANRVFVSDDSGATWVAKSIGSAVYSIISWATNGAGIIVAYAQNSAFGGVDKILYSTNNGNTWTVGHSAGTAIETGAVAYSSVLDQFMVINTEGKIFNSSDGASWIERTGMAYHPTTGLALAAVGPVFAMATQPTINPSPATKTTPGVVYTVDFGENWTMVPLGVVEASDFRLTTVRAHGGRFVAGAQGAIYLSAPLWIPEPDLNIP